MSENNNIPGVRPGFATSTKTENSFPNHFILMNNYKGSLLIKIDPYDFAGPTRSFRVRHNIEKLPIPANYALGVFMSPGALRLMEAGYFVFEDVETLIKMAESKGLYVPDSIKNRKFTLKDFERVLIKGDVEKIKKELEGASRKTIRDVITIARELYSRLSVMMVDYFEKTYKVSLSSINLND